MSRPILADSSWYIHLFRQKIDPLLELARVADSRDIATCGIVVCEVGRGWRSPKMLQRYTEAWEAMQWINSTPAIWKRTLELGWELDRKGIVLPLQDLHIAACALEVSAVVLTFDMHFKSIPGLTVTDTLY